MKVKNLKVILFIFLISIFIECFIFNINSYRIIGKEYQKKELDINELNTYGLEKVENNKYLIKESGAFIEINDINQPIGVLTFDAKANTFDQRYQIKFEYKDETTKTYTDVGLPVIIMNSNVEDDKSLNMHLTGNVQDLKIVLLNKNATIEIDKISINNKIPFKFDIIRFIIIFLVLYFLYSIFISKKLEMHIDNSSANLLITLFVSIFYIIIIFVASVNINNTKVLLDESNSYIYEQVYTKSILQGKLYLDIEPSEELKNMENPYDHFTRKIEAKDSLYDIAYYKGKYYVYFSIIPIITLFIPIHVITGKFLNIFYANILYAILGTIFSALLLKEVIKKWFNKTSIKMFIYSLLILLFGNVLLFNTGTVMMYETVQLLGYYLVMQGLYLVFRGLESKEKTKYTYITLGCLSLALAVNARPNLIFVSVFIAPILIKEFIEKIKSKEKVNIIKYTLSIALPYLTVGIAIMIFNYVRFDSILEFGAKYQLTSNNMQALGYRISTIPIGIWSMLFTPTNLTSTFPYFVTSSAEPRYIGFFATAGCGIFGISPVLYILALLPIFKNTIKEKKKELWKLVVWSLICGLIMTIAIILVAACYIRYELDFAWMFIMPAIVLILTIHENINDNYKIKKSYETVIGILVLLGVVISLSLSIVSEGRAGQRYNSYKFDTLKSKISFWE